MSKLRVALASALVIATCVVASPASAKTQVSGPNRNNVVKITVPIDCLGCKGMKAPDGVTDLADHWEATAEAAWNAAFKEWSYCNEFVFELDVDIRALKAGADARVGRHSVRVKGPAGWDGISEPTPGGPADQRVSDGTRYFRNDADGRMPADATPTVINHEIGHVIGLGDDRDAQGNAISYDVTLMVGGATLPDGTQVGFDTPLKITKNLVDRIGAQVANLGVLKCGTYRGSLDGSGVNSGQPGEVCPDPSVHHGDFTVTVASDNSAIMTGHIVNTSVCVGGFTTESDFTLIGEKEGSTISFGAGAAFPFAVDLRIRGTRATGTSTASPGPFYTVTLDFTAECLTCDEAVG